MPRLPFLPREEKFFELFEKSALNMVKAAQRLKELIDNWDNIEGRVAEITELENEGDTITHQIMEQLHRSFVTPLGCKLVGTLCPSEDIRRSG